ncbi:MAG: sigma-70 family RNA polymerase sigma factor [Planctomycetaceae bacterium]|nr:sigma-70 family RNA polymerase sigma factor [Planctomycetaceae bacterium]
MSLEGDYSHLSAMEATRWSDVLAPGDDGLQEDVRRERLERFFARYSKAVRKFLHRLLASHPQRNDLAEDCFQQFAVKFLEGRFSQCDPEQTGRFRHYLKSTLRNLVLNVYRERPVPSLDAACVEPALLDEAASERELESILRDECIRNAMQRMAEEDERQGTCLHAVMRIRTQAPTAGYHELAIVASEKLGRPVDAAWLRKRVHFARERLRECIRGEIAATVGVPTAEAIDDELATLGLHQYVVKKSG